MKKFMFTFLSLVSFTTFSTAQQKAVEKVVIKTPTVQCESCKARLEKYLSREPGVSAVKVDFKKKTTMVTYLTDRNNIENLKAAIANAGYDADDVSAEEEAYKKLPKCCQKPVEKEKLPEKKPE